MGIAVLFLVLGVVWLVQLGLAYLQARRFMARVRALRRSGTVAVGLAGTRYRGRAYVADRGRRRCHHDPRRAGRPAAHLGRRRA